MLLGPSIGIEIVNKWHVTSRILTKIDSWIVFGSKINQFSKLGQVWVLQFLTNLPMYYLGLIRFKKKIFPNRLGPSPAQFKNSDHIKSPFPLFSLIFLDLLNETSSKLTPPIYPNKPTFSHFHLITLRTFIICFSKFLFTI